MDGSLYTIVTDDFLDNAPAPDRQRNFDRRAVLASWYIANDPAAGHTIAPSSVRSRSFSANCSSKRSKSAVEFAQLDAGGIDLGAAAGKFSGVLDGESCQFVEKVLIAEKAIDAFGESVGEPI
jgi:hypothetical protein